MTTGILTSHCVTDSEVKGFTPRAYGDSSPVALSEETAVEDGKAVLRWEISSRNDNNVITTGGSVTC